MEKGNRPTGLIAYELGRSEYVIRSKANELGISLNRQALGWVNEKRKSQIHKTDPDERCRYADGAAKY